MAGLHDQTMKSDPEYIKFAAGVDPTKLINTPTDKPVGPQEASKLTKRWFSAQMVVIFAVLLDIAGTAGSGALVAFFYPGYASGANWITYSSFIAWGTVLLLATMSISRCYAFGVLLTPFRKLSTMVGGWTVTFAFLLASIFFLKSGPELSRVWLVSWATSGLLFFIAWRVGYSEFIRHLNQDGHFNKRGVLVGGGGNAAHVISVIENSQESGINLLGIFDDRADNRAPAEVKNLRKLGKIDDLIDYVRSNPVDTLIVTLPTTAETRLAQIVDRLWILPVNIRLSAASQKLRYTNQSYSYIGNLPCLNLYDKPLGEWGPLLKDITDKIIATLALIGLSPVFLATALAVKLNSKGPIFFKQKRYGFNNELIEVYKFRSMYTDMSDATASQLVTKGDPRVTKVGRFIRRTTIDELPQLFNVMKGELSLVGPRPHATQAKAGAALYENVVRGYFARHRVKPGLTGWAQVNGWRGETDTAEKIERRVECDLYYIENWSLSFDLYILARTPLALITTKNAY